MMNSISTHVSDEIFSLIQNRCSELGLNKSEYLRKCIGEELGVYTKESPKTVKPPISILERLKKTFGAEVITSKNKIKYSLENTQSNNKNPLNEWICPIHNKRNELLWNGEPSIYKNKLVRYHKTKYSRNPYFKIRAGLNGVFYLKEILDSLDIIRVKDFKWIKKELDYPSSPSFTALLVNTAEGFFDSFLENIKSKMDQITFDTNGSGMVVLCGVESSIFLREALEIVRIIENKGFSEKLVFNLEKSYPLANELDLRVICENWDNSELLRILPTSNGNRISFENNPQKRREKAI